MKNIIRNAEIDHRETVNEPAFSSLLASGPPLFLAHHRGDRDVQTSNYQSN